VLPGAEFFFSGSAGRAALKANLAGSSAGLPSRTVPDGGRARDFREDSGSLTGCSLDHPPGGRPAGAHRATSSPLRRMAFCRRSRNSLFGRPAGGVDTKSRPKGPALLQHDWPQGNVRELRNAPASVPRFSVRGRLNYAPHLSAVHPSSRRCRHDVRLQHGFRAGEPSKPLDARVAAEQVEGGRSPSSCCRATYSCTAAAGLVRPLAHVRLERFRIGIAVEYTQGHKVISMAFLWVHCVYSDDGVARRNPQTANSLGIKRSGPGRSATSVSATISDWWGGRGTQELQHRRKPCPPHRLCGDIVKAPTSADCRLV